MENKVNAADHYHQRKEIPSLNQNSLKRVDYIANGIKRQSNIQKWP